jgi:hypothetical protein
MKEHETSVKEHLLTSGESTDWQALLHNHERTIAAMQHERLVHLLVTLAFGLFLLLSIGIALLQPSLPVYILSGLFFVMLIFYVAHYFFLENTVQRWYLLTDEIVKRLQNNSSRSSC